MNEDKTAKEIADAIWDNANVPGSDGYQYPEFHLSMELKEFLLMMLSGMILLSGWLMLGAYILLDIRRQ